MLLCPCSPFFPSKYEPWGKLLLLHTKQHWSNSHGKTVQFRYHCIYQKCEGLQWIVIQLAKSHSQKRKIMAQNEFVYSGTDSEERKWKE